MVILQHDRIVILVSCGRQNDAITMLTILLTY